MKAVGIDPGTATWDFVALKDGIFAKELTIPTEAVKKAPEELIELIKKFSPQIVAAPSGYGLPLRDISELNDGDFFRINLKKHKTGYGGSLSDIGLTKVLKLLVESGISGYILPGVKHLPSVPDYRKINKIDMGTPDKVCSAVLAVFGYENYSGASFILAEIGSAFNAFISVENGKIIDGIGGTLASSGMMSSGGMDGEIAYLLGGIQKESLFRGGAADVDEKFRDDYLIEGILKDIARLSAVTNSRTIILSGSMSRNAEFRKKLENKIRDSKILSKFEIKTLINLPGAVNSSHAAQGAALIADGLSGGRYEKLVNHLELKNACGSVFDYVYIKGFNESFTH
jgi:predicted butyrate kinase (DUF1464 family)